MLREQRDGLVEMGGLSLCLKIALLSVVRVSTI